MARFGKIERLPATLRDELGRRVLDGQSFVEIAEWINHEPEALKRWQRHFPDNPRLDDNNLSNWRYSGGFERWKKEVKIGQMAEQCFRIAEAAGGNVTRGAAALLAGQVLTAIESLDDELEDAGDDDDDGGGKKTSKPDKLVALAMALKMGAEAEAIPARTKLQQGAAKLAVRRTELEELKVQRTTCEMFVKWAANEAAKTIALGNEPKERKLELLSKMFFGEAPDDIGPRGEGGDAP